MSCPTRSGRERPTRVARNCEPGGGEFVPCSESVARLGAKHAQLASCLHRVASGPDIGYGAREQSGRSPRLDLDKTDQTSVRGWYFHARMLPGVKTAVRCFAQERRGGGNLSFRRRGRAVSEFGFEDAIKLGSLGKPAYKKNNLRPSASSGSSSPVLILDFTGLSNVPKMQRWGGLTCPARRRQSHRDDRR